MTIPLLFLCTTTVSSEIFVKALLRTTICQILRPMLPRMSAQKASYFPSMETLVSRPRCLFDVIDLNGGVSVTYSKVCVASLAPRYLARDTSCSGRYLSYSN